MVHAATPAASPTAASPPADVGATGAYRCSGAIRPPPTGRSRRRRWRVYAERGLGGEPVAVWLYAEHLTLVYQDEPLAQYRVTYQPDQRRLKAVTPAQLFETPYRSPQEPLWMWGDDDWLPVLRLPAYAPRRRRPPAVEQPALFPLDEVGA